MPLADYPTLVYQQAGILGVIVIEYRSKFHEIGGELGKLLISRKFTLFKQEIP